MEKRQPGGKWCPQGLALPTVKHTPAKESKVSNCGAPYCCSDLRISRSLHQGGKPGSDMRSSVHNGEGPYPHPDVVVQEAITSRNRISLLPKLTKNRLALCILYI